MKRLSLLTILVLAMLISACGAEPPPPTINAADVQNTAVAAAMTMAEVLALSAARLTAAG